jgi:hypothetical protein
MHQIHLDIEISRALEADQNHHLRGQIEQRGIRPAGFVRHLAISDR